MSGAIAKQWDEHWSKRGPECPEKVVAKEYLSATLERDDLAMLLRRMLWASAVENDGRGLGLIRLSAVDYLRRHGLSGKVTREDMHKDPQGMNSSRQSAILGNGGDSGSDAKPPEGESTGSETVPSPRT